MALPRRPAKGGRARRADPRVALRRLRRLRVRRLAPPAGRPGLACRNGVHPARGARHGRHAACSPLAHRSISTRRAARATGPDQSAGAGSERSSLAAEVPSCAPPSSADALDPPAREWRPSSLGSGSASMRGADQRALRRRWSMRTWPSSRALSPLSRSRATPSEAATGGLRPPALRGGRCASYWRVRTTKAPYSRNWRSVVMTSVTPRRSMTGKLCASHSE